MNKLKIDNNYGELLTYKQTAEKCNIGVNTVMKLAVESGALVKIGHISRIDWKTFYKYLIDKYRIIE